MTEDSNVLGVAWYSPLGWAELCALPGAAIEKTYDEFVRTFERAVAEFAAQGVRTVKVQVDGAQMVEWCCKYGMAPDAAARAKFGLALMFARQQGRDVMSVPVEDGTREALQ